MRRKAASPTVKKLHALCTRRNLVVKVNGYRFGQSFHQQIPATTFAPHQFFRVHILLASPALNRITGKGERRPRKTDNGNGIRDICPGLTNGFVNKIELLWVIQTTDAFDIFIITNRVMNDRSITFRELELETHGHENRQQIRKDDCRVHSQAINCSAHHLTAQLRLPTEFQKTLFCADLAILGHVASSLPHQPDGRSFGRLPTTCPHEKAGIGRVLQVGQRRRCRKTTFF